VVYLALLLAVPFALYHPGYLIFHLLMASMLLSMLGLLAGMVSNHYDQIAALTGYVITPLSFLSGTFYSIHSLPDFLYKISLVNPFFYMIDGFRYSLTDHHDGSLSTGIIVMIIGVVLVWSLVYTVFSRGWRIKT
jgi:ABC-2 type transport system permease protein